jgi:3-hydroxyacyl-[acyl-carrier-protein] dehydratase
MPGVLMLEAMFQTAMWLVRRTEDFASAVVVLKEARNIKYATFVQPGEVLVLTAEYLKADSHTVTLKVTGHVHDTLAVSGRLILAKFNQAENQAGYELVDAGTRFRMRQEFNRIYQPAA